MEAVHMQIHDNAIPSKMHEKLSLSHGIRCLPAKRKYITTVIEPSCHIVKRCDTLRQNKTKNSDLDSGA
jgi:hypothetical protein